MKFSYFLFPLHAATAFAASKECTTNRITAASITNGTVDINTSPTLPFQSPALTSLNATAWEYWYFDGVSTSTKAGITIVFFRDPSLLSQGLGPLRVSVDAVWENGTTFNSVIFADESVIDTCGEVTRGRWTGSQINSTFEFHNSNSYAEIHLFGTTITGDSVSGTFSLRSFSRPRYPDGLTYPNRDASVIMAPLLSWNEGIPGGDVATNLVLKGRPLEFQGIGGTDRNFAPYIWDFLADHWWWVRSVTGPFTVVYWKFVSAIDHQTYSWAYLERHGKPVFRSNIECGAANATYDISTDCVVFTLKEGGNVKGSFNDNSTGFGIEFRGKDKTWVFDIEHTNVVFEAPLLSNDEYSRFVNSASGKEVGGATYTGAGKSEQNRIRQVFPIF